MGPASKLVKQIADVRAVISNWRADIEGPDYDKPRGIMAGVVAAARCLIRDLESELGDVREK